jgi:hypothetical protein
MGPVFGEQVVVVGLSFDEAGLAMSARVGHQYFPCFHEMGYLMPQMFDGTAVAMDEDQGLALSIGLDIHADSVDRIVPAGLRIIAIGRLGLARQLYGKGGQKEEAYILHIDLFTDSISMPSSS